jgi:hypothetical protein
VWARVRRLFHIRRQDDRQRNAVRRPPGKPSTCRDRRATDAAGRCQAPSPKTDPAHRSFLRGRRIGRTMRVLILSRSTPAAAAFRSIAKAGSLRDPQRRLRHHRPRGEGAPCPVGSCSCATRQPRWGPAGGPPVGRPQLPRGRRRLGHPGRRAGPADRDCRHGGGPDHSRHARDRGLCGRPRVSPRRPGTVCTCWASCSAWVSKSTSVSNSTVTPVAD